MPSIIIKYQKCGKQNCKCTTQKILHGPYFWLVRYVKPKYSYHKGKYKWKYIGRSSRDLENYLINEGSDYGLNFSGLEKKFQEYEDELKILKDISKKSQSKHFKLKETNLVSLN